MNLETRVREMILKYADMAAQDAEKFGDSELSDAIWNSVVTVEIS